MPTATPPFQRQTALGRVMLPLRMTLAVTSIKLKNKLGRAQPCLRFALLPLAPVLMAISILLRMAIGFKDFVAVIAANGFSPSKHYLLSLFFRGETVAHKDGMTAAEMKPLIFGGNLAAVPKGIYATNPHKACAGLRNQAINYVENSTVRLGLERHPFEHESSRRGLKKGHPGTRHFHGIKDSASFRQSNLKDDKPKKGQLETHIDSITLRSTNNIHNLLAGNDNITVAYTWNPPDLAGRSHEASYRFEGEYFVTTLERATYEKDVLLDVESEEVAVVSQQPRHYFAYALLLIVLSLACSPIGNKDSSFLGIAFGWVEWKSCVPSGMHFEPINRPYFDTSLGLENALRGLFSQSYPSPVWGLLCFTINAITLFFVDALIGRLSTIYKFFAYPAMVCNALDVVLNTIGMPVISWTCISFHTPWSPQHDPVPGFVCGALLALVLSAVHMLHAKVVTVYKCYRQDLRESRCLVWYVPATHYRGLAAIYHWRQFKLEDKLLKRRYPVISVAEAEGGPDIYVSRHFDSEKNIYLCLAYHGSTNSFRFHSSQFDLAIGCLKSKAGVATYTGANLRVMSKGATDVPEISTLKSQILSQYFTRKYRVEPTDIFSITVPIYPKGGRTGSLPQDPGPSPDHDGVVHIDHPDDDPNLPKQVQLRAFAPPIARGLQFATVSSTGSTADTLRARIAMPQHICGAMPVLKTTIIFLANVFSDLMYAETGGAELMTLEEYVATRRKKRMLLDYDIVSEHWDSIPLEDVERILKAFQKRELQAKFDKAGRLICGFSSESQVKGGVVSNGFATSVKDACWNGSGKTPQQTTDQVVSVCIGKDGVVTTDFTAQDASVDEVKREIELIFLLSKYRGETEEVKQFIRDWHASDYSNTILLRAHPAVLQAFMRGSGSPFTTYGNTPLTAFTNFVALLSAHATNHLIAAYKDYLNRTHGEAVYDCSGDAVSPRDVSSDVKEAVNELIGRKFLIDPLKYYHENGRTTSADTEIDKLYEAGETSRLLLASIISMVASDPALARSVYLGLGISSGDDTIMRDVCVRDVSFARDALGWIIKTPESGLHPEFLGRFYKDPFSGCRVSCADPTRQLGKLLVTGQDMDLVPLDDIYDQKALSVALNDLRTPILGQWAEARLFSSKRGRKWLAQIREGFTTGAAVKTIDTSGERWVFGKKMETDPTVSFRSRVVAEEGLHTSYEQDDEPEWIYAIIAEQMPGFDFRLFREWYEYSMSWWVAYLPDYYCWRDAPTCWTAPVDPSRPTDPRGTTTYFVVMAGAMTAVVQAGLEHSFIKAAINTGSDVADPFAKPPGEDVLYDKEAKFEENPTFEDPASNSDSKAETVNNGSTSADSSSAEEEVPAPGKSEDGSNKHSDTEVCRSCKIEKPKTDYSLAQKQRRHEGDRLCVVCAAIPVEKEQQCHCSVCDKGKRSSDFTKNQRAKPADARTCLQCQGDLLALARKEKRPQVEEPAPAITNLEKAMKQSVSDVAAVDKEAKISKPPKTGPPEPKGVETRGKPPRSSQPKARKMAKRIGQSTLRERIDFFGLEDVLKNDDEYCLKRLGEGKNARSIRGKIAATSLEQVLIEDDAYRAKKAAGRPPDGTTGAGGSKPHNGTMSEPSGSD